MSTQYNGLPENVSYPAPVAIQSSTNATPIKLTTAANHNLTTGDLVSVKGHVVNTKANCAARLVDVINATQFTLRGSTGNGAGGANGNVQALTFGATYAIPSDGDPDSGNTFDVGDEALGDRTAILLSQFGTLKLAAEGIFGLSLGGTTQGYQAADTIPGAAWATNSNNASGLVQMRDSGSSTYINWVLAGVQQGDILEVYCETTAQTLGTGGATYTANFAIAYQFIPWTGGGGLTTVLSSPSFAPSKSLTTPGSSAVTDAPLTLRSRIVVPAMPDGSIDGMVYIAPACNVNGSGSETANLRGDRIFGYRVWRSTGVPQ